MVTQKCVIGQSSLKSDFRVKSCLSYLKYSFKMRKMGIKNTKDAGVKSRFSFLKSAIIGRKVDFQPEKVTKDREVFNEFADSQTAVWCQLSPGIDPDQWAFICRCLGSLPPQQFLDVSSQLQMSHKNVKKALKEHVRGLLGLNSTANTSDIPIVSTGPSGIGGKFQREY